MLKKTVRNDPHRTQSKYSIHNRNRTHEANYLQNEYRKTI